MGRKGLKNILDSTIILILCREIKRTWFKVLILISVEHLIQTFLLNHYVRFDFIDIKKHESTKTTFRKPEQREFSTQNNLGTPVTHEPENETTKIKKSRKMGSWLFRSILVSETLLHWAKNANHAPFLDRLWIINMGKNIKTNK